MVRTLCRSRSLATATSTLEERMAALRAEDMEEASERAVRICEEEAEGEEDTVLRKL